jgi:hypothetical protein
VDVLEELHNWRLLKKGSAPNCSIYIEFEVLTVVVTKSYVFWDITPCSPVKLNQHVPPKHWLTFMQDYTALYFRRKNSAVCT